MGFLDNILNLFNISNTKKVITNNNNLEISTFKLPGLINIGIDSSNCPYCNVKLQKFPTRKTKCKNCGKYMYVRTRPIDCKKVLLKEQDIGLLEEEWEKRRYINEKTKVRQSLNNQIADNLVIDASEETNSVIKDLIKHYKDYCNYDEILRIDEKDRLPIMKYIWSKWMVHCSSIEKDLKYIYPQYDFKDLRLITLKEHKHIIAFHKIKQYKDLGITFLEYTSDKERNYYRLHPEEIKNWIRICYVEDLPHIVDVWYTDGNRIDKYSESFIPPPLNMIINKRKSIIFKTEPEGVKLWQNGKINKMSIEEFYEYCEENNIDIIIENN